MNETGPVGFLRGGRHHHAPDATQPSPNQPGQGVAGADALQSFEQSFEQGFEQGFEQALRNRAQGQGGLGQCQAAEQPWTTTYANGQPTVDLGNYTLQLNKNSSQWTLTNKATGAQTNVWGDPHVDENGTSWNFKNNTTFQLADGTQISVKTVPYGNGMTVSSELDITQGGRGMKITGLEQTDSNDPLKIADGLDGYALSASNFGNNVVYESGKTWLDQSAAVITGDVANKDNL